MENASDATYEASETGVAESWLPGRKTAHRQQRERASMFRPDELLDQERQSRHARLVAARPFLSQCYESDREVSLWVASHRVLC